MAWAVDIGRRCLEHVSRIYFLSCVFFFVFSTFLYSVPQFEKLMKLGIRNEKMFISF